MDWSYVTMSIDSVMQSDLKSSICPFPCPDSRQSLLAAPCSNYLILNLVHLDGWPFQKI